MKTNVKPITPRCGICKKLYSFQDDDGSGLCLQCRPTDSQPLVKVKRQLKKTIILEVGKMQDDFDQEEELQAQETSEINNNEQQELHEVLPSTTSNEDQATEANSTMLKIEDILEFGRYGVSNSQMIPAIQKAIAEKSVEKLILLKQSYMYIFDRSTRYLKKAEREFITQNNI